MYKYIHCQIIILSACGLGIVDYIFESSVFLFVFVMYVYLDVRPFQTNQMLHLKGPKSVTNEN